MIILEGADGCGKSTLSNKLSEYFAIKVYHPGRPQSELELYEAINVIRSHKELVIFDRVPWISDVVYNNALQRPHKIPTDKMKTFESNTDIVIWCNPSISDVTIVDGKSHKSEEYMNQVRANSQSLRDEYSMFFKKYQYESFRYDYTDQDSLQECIKYIQNRLH